MGNYYSSTQSDLRDREVFIPKNIAKAKSNIIMAMFDGHFFPCMILRKSKIIQDGYAVYFLHNSVETDIPSTNVIGNLKALVNCEVNFIDDDGNSCTGVVRATDCEKKLEQPMNFFIATCTACRWVSLPFVFLTKEQAQIFI